jgi:hypothetical protein
MLSACGSTFAAAKATAAPLVALLSGAFVEHQPGVRRQSVAEPGQRQTHDGGAIRQRGDIAALDK